MCDAMCDANNSANSGLQTHRTAHAHGCDMRAAHLRRGTAMVRTVEHRRPFASIKRHAIALGFALALPLVLAGYARAMYLDAGSIETSPGVYANPQDAVCVVGLKFDGTLDVLTSATTSRDCIVYTTPAIAALGCGLVSGISANTITAMMMLVSASRMNSSR